MPSTWRAPCSRRWTREPLYPRTNPAPARRGAGLIGRQRRRPPLRARDDWSLSRLRQIAQAGRRGEVQALLSATPQQDARQAPARLLAATERGHTVRLSFVERVQLQRAEEQSAAVDRDVIAAGLSHRPRKPVGRCADCGGPTYKVSSVRCCDCAQRHHDRMRGKRPRPRP